MAHRTNLRLILAASLLAGYWCALFVATHLPLPADFPMHRIDKLLHVAAYAGLALLLATIWSLCGRSTWKSYFILLALIAVYGLADEWIQLQIPGRTADVFDWTADLVGGTIGLALHWIGGVVITAMTGSAGAPRAAERKE